MHRGPHKARASRAGLALLPLALTFAACIEGPPAWAPLPIASGPPSEGCLHARDLRARVPELLGEGRLNRAVRVMQRAEDLCPVETEATWAPRVTALAGMGRAAEALQLVHRIEISDRSTDEDKRAAAAARAASEEQARAVAAHGARRDDPELFDPTDKDRAAAAATFHRGAIAERAGDHAAAKKLFLEAWATWHPYPRALVEAGLAAAAQGEKVEAHTLWDRAAYDDTSIALRPEVADGAPESISPTVPVAWSPGGERLAVGGRAEIAIYDAGVVPLFHLRTAETAVAIAFSADGARLFAGLEGGGVVVFDVATGAAERQLAGHHGAVRLIAPSPDGRTLATTGDDGDLRLWNLEAGGVPKAVALPHGATAIAWSADTATLAWAGEDRRITLWDAQKGAPGAVLAARAGAVRAIAFAGGALTVVTATERLSYDLAKPRLPPKVLGRERSDEASFAPGKAGDRVGLVVVANGRITVEDPGTDQAVRGFTTTDPVGFAGHALAPGGRALALVQRSRSLSVVTLDGGATRYAGIARPASLGALAVAPDGKTVAAASEDGRVLAWTVAPSRFQSTTPGLARALAFSSDGKTLALGLATGRIELRDPLADAPGAAIDAGSAVRALAFSPDGAHLAVATDASSVLVFDTATRAMARELHLAPGALRAVGFSPDGHALLLAAKEGVVRWDLAQHDGVRLAPFGPDPRDAAFTPDGAGIVVADALGLLLMGKLTGKPAAPAPTKIGVASQVLSLAVGKSGSIATAEGDRAITLRTPEGKAMQRFSAESAVRDVAFLGTGLVVASCADGAARVFHAPGTTAAAVLRPAPGKRASLVLTGGGLLDVVGPDAAAARASVRCRLGQALYPFEVCADQFEVPGILQIVIAGQDPAEAEP